jgi:hypothetical protein
MIRGLFTGIAAFALMSGAALAQTYAPPPSADDPRYDRDADYNAWADRGPAYVPDRPYYRYEARPYVYEPDPGAHAVVGGATGAAAGAAIGCLITIPIGCAPGAAIGAAVGGGTGAVAGAASTPPPRAYYPPPDDDD